MSALGRRARERAGSTRNRPRCARESARAGSCSPCAKPPSRRARRTGAAASPTAKESRTGPSSRSSRASRASRTTTTRPRLHKVGRLLERLSTRNVDDLRTMATALSNLLGIAQTPRGAYATDQITQAELHWGIRRVLQLLASQRPFVLVLEDLHWAEPTLLELVRSLTEIQGPILVVGRPAPSSSGRAPPPTRPRRQPERRRACSTRRRSEAARFSRSSSARRK